QHRGRRAEVLSLDFFHFHGLCCTMLDIADSFAFLGNKYPWSYCYPAGKAEQLLPIKKISIWKARLIERVN
ncbi:hypothetical protein N0463_29155, partial [Pseudomonas aeruginosa]|nr:hypothetical protein [Pseudomonas aeruginosa]